MDSWPFPKWLGICWYTSVILLLLYIIIYKSVHSLAAFLSPAETKQHPQHPKIICGKIINKRREDFPAIFEYQRYSYTSYRMVLWRHNVPRTPCRAQLIYPCHCRPRDHPAHLNHQVVGDDAETLNTETWNSGTPQHSGWLRDGIKRFFNAFHKTTPLKCLVWPPPSLRILKMIGSGHGHLLYDRGQTWTDHRLPRVSDHPLPSINKGFSTMNEIFESW